MTMNIVLLMAGGSDAFHDAGYQYPKNLVEVERLPLVQRVLDSLQPILHTGARCIVVVRSDENRQYHTADVVRLLVEKSEIVEVQGPTAGAACSALLAVEHLENDHPLLIINGDQIVTANLGEIVSDFASRKLDGGIIVFEAVHPRWSYVRCDANGFVVETAEKRPISNLATTGIYYFRKGRDFVRSAMEMIKKGASVDESYYICPAYNEMILKQAHIGTHKISRNEYFSLATPQGVHAYEEYLRSQTRAVVYAV